MRHYASQTLRTAVYETLDGRMSLRDLEACTGIPHESLRRAVHVMEAEGEVVRVGKRQPYGLGRPEAIYEMARARSAA